MPRIVRVPRELYARHSEEVARDLLGKVLIRALPDGRAFHGRIVETEAYHGPDDRASHGHRGETPRNRIMFGPPGFAYVYQIYGLHFCLNVTTDVEGVASAVLLRALAPIPGRAWPAPDGDARAGAGPAKLCAAFLIDKKEYGEDFVRGGALRIGDDGTRLAASEVARGPRIGVDYAGEWAQTPWRFWVKDHPSVSKLPSRRRKP